jgi:hypothetical protein
MKIDPFFVTITFVVIFVEANEKLKIAENYVALFSAATHKPPKLLQTYFRRFFLAAKNCSVAGVSHIPISILHQF